MPILFVLGLAGFASTFGFRLIDPLVPDIARSFAVSLPTAATLATSYALMYAAAQPILGPIGDTLGKAKLIRIGVGALTVTLVISAFAPDFLSLAIMRALSGIAAGGIIPLAIAAIGDRVPVEGRQVAIGRFLFAILAGQLAGTVGAGTLAPIIGWRGVLVVAGLISALAFLACVVYLAPRPNPTREPLSFGSAIARYRDILANPKAIPLYVVVTLEGFLGTSHLPFVAAILEERAGVGAFEAGLVIGALGVGGLIYTLIVSQLVAVLSPGGLVIGGAALMGAAFVAFGLTSSWTADAAIFVFLGFGFMMMHNTLQVIATELAPEARGSAIAIFACAFFAGQALAPLGFGPLYLLIGVAPALTIVAVGIVALGLYARRRLVG